MTVLRQGIDLVECDRIRGMIARHGDTFLQRILTNGERRRAADFNDPTTHVAGRWAAKEAVFKMLGTGLVGSMSWQDVEIAPDERGQPMVTLSGESAAVAQRLGVSSVLLSITHTRQMAAASAIGLG